MKITGDILELIGNTPLLKLRRVTAGLDVNVYVKCEYLNPSGSIKDRMALRMIEEAERKGALRRGGTIIEQTSGNTGPALAFVGGVKGYKVHLFIPAQWVGTYSPAERIKIMKYFGAEVEPITVDEYEGTLKDLSDEEKDIATTAIGMKTCYELERSDKSIWWSNQMCNPYNTLAHRDTTGREILEQLDGKVDGWVASVGTGGTLLGVAEALRAQNPAVRVNGVVPTDAPVTEWVRSGMMDKLLKVFDLPKFELIIERMYEQGLPDEVMTVTDMDAREMANRLCREEGLFCGMSSGANVYAAIQTAKKLGREANVVTVLVDRRDRYFSEYPTEHYVI